MVDLEHQLKLELEDKMRRAKKECQYNPTRFNQMLAKYGVVETAKRLGLVWEIKVAQNNKYV